MRITFLYMNAPAGCIASDTGTAKQRTGKSSSASFGSLPREINFNSSYLLLLYPQTAVVHTQQPNVKNYYIV